MTDLDLLLKAIADDLGDPSDGGAPVEFRDSLALCALNSAYSLRGSSAAATNMLARYRAFRPTADTDSGADLLQAMDGAGGPVDFAREVLRNESKLPGTSRVRPEGIYEGLSRLAALETPVSTTEHLRTAVAAGDTSVEAAWLSVKGFGALAWSYLIMNAGVGTETKPDMMVQRYLARVLGEGQKLTDARTRTLLQLAAAELNVEPRDLDRAIWLHESPSK
ncbi:MULTISPECIES: hypothetical protein [Paenarthrobacter]|uniref:Heme peroxidase n=1 Tax=Paenarthrobacter ureafaciens TaxID=37931 RepID=A0AAX3EPA8_PAEUR|nr:MULTISPECIES: hypothetical protein [Paenarthrobacter]NKR09931.1 hypothetical protein [Arthrobacter sp. M5]NKR16746.1 hypothetical protein [Arthrobacter sp. M6]MCX8455117.1 hypothetical protein [Paenarthrobacter ureafaciens]MCY0974531.1 hypothetical protein [Paenarthrobacter ureafaciens]MDO5866920.1 hypothetical protein [Paenarthrobacter sp. SD-2]